jgi:hypothetical protein
MRKLLFIALFGAQAAFAAPTTAVSVSDSVAVSGSAADNVGNHQSVTFASPAEVKQDISYSGTYRIKNTPEVFVGSPASGPCNGLSGGAGVSIPGFSIAANTSTVDAGCTARETARVAFAIGRTDIANAILENIDIVQVALQAKADRELKASK